MTRNRRSKRAIRSRVEQTGEKYTQARRALLAPGGYSGSAGEDPGVTIKWPQDNALPPIREITAAVSDALPGHEDT